jgi:hypothetical protein
MRAFRCHGEQQVPKYRTMSDGCNFHFLTAVGKRSITFVLFKFWRTVIFSLYENHLPGRNVAALVNLTDA